MRQLTRAAPLATALFVASLALATASRADTIVLDYDGALPSQRADFQMTPYLEDLTTVRVDTGHYEFVADVDGAEGDLVLNIDEQEHGLTQINVTVGGGHPFDAVSLEVVNPAEAPGEITISAVGGGAGSVSAPTAAGSFALGAGFQGIDALVITQNAPGAFAFDDLTLEVVPEPALAPSLAAAALALAALRRRRR